MLHYFNFTNNNTKMAHTPTVTGNCASAALCTNEPPLGNANVSSIMHNAVNMPRVNLLFQVMVYPSPWSQSNLIKVDLIKVDLRTVAFNIDSYLRYSFDRIPAI
jgi:hypothetical protein